MSMGLQGGLGVVLKLKNGGSFKSTGLIFGERKSKLKKIKEAIADAAGWIQ